MYLGVHQNRFMPTQYTRTWAGFEQLVAWHNRAVKAAAAFNDVVCLIQRMSDGPDKGGLAAEANKLFGLYEWVWCRACQPDAFLWKTQGAKKKVEALEKVTANLKKSYRKARGLGQMAEARSIPPGLIALGVVGLTGLGLLLFTGGQGDSTAYAT